MLENALDYQFKDKNLLTMVVTRTAAIQEGLVEEPQHQYSFTTIKFLGTHILGLLISDIIYSTNLFQYESDLTLTRSSILSHNGFITKIARSIKLGNALIMGRGERNSAIQDNDKVLFSHIQALFGAIWIDCNSDYQTVYRILIHICEFNSINDCSSDRLIGIFKELAKSPGLADLQAKLGHQFNDPNLLVNALIRQSALEENIVDANVSFQTLEFLGDKVFGFVIAEWLAFNHAHNISSESLTPLFDHLVSNLNMLATTANAIDLGKTLIIGRGEESVRFNQRKLADHLEALIGALWLDISSDYNKAKSVIINLFKYKLEEIFTSENLESLPFVRPKEPPALKKSIRLKSRGIFEFFLAYCEKLSVKKEQAQQKQDDLINPPATSCQISSIQLPNHDTISLEKPDSEILEITLEDQVNKQNNENPLSYAAVAAKKPPQAIPKVPSTLFKAAPKKPKTNTFNIHSAAEFPALRKN